MVTWSSATVYSNEEEPLKMDLTVSQSEGSDEEAEEEQPTNRQHSASRKATV
jgi:hypothetical protein